MTNTGIFDLFPIPVYKTNFSNQFDSLVEYLKSLPMHCDHNAYAVSPDMSVDNRLFNDNHLDSFKETIRPHVRGFMREVLAIDGEPAFTQCWVNKNRPNESTTRHMHANSFVSGVFYFDVGVESEIVFHKNMPLGNYIMEFDTIPSAGDRSPYAYEWAKISVKNGDLILFPSYLEHSVPPNESEQNRWSLAFNVITRGQIGKSNQLTRINIAEDL